MSERSQPDPKAVAAETWRLYTEELGFSEEDLVDLAPDVLDPQAVIGKNSEAEGDDDPKHAHALSLVRNAPPPSHELERTYTDRAASHLDAIKRSRQPYVPPEVLARQRREQQLEEIAARAREASGKILDVPDKHDRPA